MWTRRDPFAEFDAIVRQAFGQSAQQERFTPRAEIARDGDDAVVRLEIPGIDVEKDVTVEIKDAKLVVRGERRDERAEERDGRSLREVRYGAFRRSFGLPAHVTADAVAATYDAGVLTVRVAGAYAGSGARQIPVTAAQAVAAPPLTPPRRPAPRPDSRVRMWPGPAWGRATGMPGRGPGRLRTLCGVPAEVRPSARTPYSLRSGQRGRRPPAVPRSLTPPSQARRARRRVRGLCEVAARSAKWRPW